MMGTGGNGQFSSVVPPGFRFHPTDEELLYYYLRKKVSYDPIDLDVITEVDLNKLEPWDLKDKCRIGSGPQNEWYFFSHKDKKYPTGSRTNRATAAGFWKATGRDKAIHLVTNSKRIGMRKTLVFYTGRAPHGHKTDWIMHEYRLLDDHNNASEVQEDGWVVCRVFKKKNHNRSPFQASDHDHDHRQLAAVVDHHHQELGSTDHHLHTYDSNISSTTTTTLFDHGSMHLPQLLTTSPHDHAPYFLAPPPRHHLVHNNDQTTSSTSMTMINDIDCSKNLLSLMSANGDKALLAATTSNVTTDWSFLDKLLASNPGTTFDHHQPTCNDPSSSQLPFPNVTPSSHIFPFHYLGYENDILKFSK